MISAEISGNKAIIYPITKAELDYLSNVCAPKAVFKAFGARFMSGNFFKLFEILKRVGNEFCTNRGGKTR